MYNKAVIIVPRDKNKKRTETWVLREDTAQPRLTLQLPRPDCLFSPLAARHILVNKLREFCV